MTMMEALCEVVAGTVEECGPSGAPSGVVYAALSSVGVDYDVYNQIIRKLQEDGRIKISGDVLRSA